MQTVARPRGVVGGAVLIAVGVAYLLLAIGFQHALAMLFVAMGIAFAVAYVLGARQYVYLVPAGVLLGFGLGQLLPALFDIPDRFAAPVFLSFLALGLVAVYLLAPERRWPLVPALIIAAGAVAATFAVPMPRDTLAYAVPVIVIAVGAYLLVEQSGH